MQQNVQETNRSEIGTQIYNITFCANMFRGEAGADN